MAAFQHQLNHDEVVIETNYLTGSIEIAAVAGDAPCMIDKEWSSSVGWNHFIIQLHGAQGLAYDRSGLFVTKPHVRADLLNAEGGCLARKRSGAGSDPLAPRWESEKTMEEAVLTFGLPSRVDVQGLGVVLHLGTKQLKLGNTEKIFGHTQVFAIQELLEKVNVKQTLEISSGGSLEVTLRYVGADGNCDLPVDDRKDTVPVTGNPPTLTLTPYIGIAAAAPLNIQFMTESTARFTLKFYLWDTPPLEDVTAAEGGDRTGGQPIEESRNGA